MSSICIEWTRRTALAGVMLVASASLGAQQKLTSTPLATLVGFIKDSSGHPIPGVEVWLRGSDLFTHTNDAGGFRLPPVAEGNVKLSVRRLGFEPALVDLKLHAGQTDSLVLSLTETATTLPGVNIEEESRSHRLLSGFWDRRSKGFGHFVTHDEIVAKNPRDFVDIVRMIPGVNIVERNGRPTIRFRANNAPRGDCPPQYWVDGMRVENASPDEFPASDIEAVEVYNGIATIPPQFTPKMTTYACGVIVIWTRLPGT
jgi:hypothetical protein